MSKDKLLIKLSAAQFALWEIHVYLDTHPGNAEAEEYHQKYKKQYEELVKEYEALYGPLTLQGQNSDEWLCDPWPWDNAAN